MGAPHGFGEPVLRRWEERARLVRDGRMTGSEVVDDGEGGDYRGLVEALLRHSFDAIVVNARESRWIVEMSESFCALTGYEREELLGRTSVELGLVDPDGTRAQATRNADAGVEGIYETRLHRKDGEERWVEFSHQLLGADFVLTIARDVTRRRGLEEDLRLLADSDPLTGVLNHRSFRQEVDHRLRESDRSGDRVGLLVIDIDHFKAVNDEHGHLVGDEVLRVVARTLRRVVRDVDFIGRVGGDEFAVLLTRTVRGGAERVAHDVEHALRDAAVSTSAGMIPIEASIGIATSGEARRDYESLVSAADRAMYLHKSHRSRASQRSQP